MRFGNGSPKKQILQLQGPLSEEGIDLIVYDDKTGDIKGTVEEIMEDSAVFLACGTEVR